MTRDELRRWFKGRCTGEWYRPHVERYVVTADLLQQLDVASAVRVLDVGGGSPLREWLDAQGPLVRGTDDRFDLRSAIAWPQEFGPFDVVLCSEVIEHLKDFEPTTPRDTWDGSGAGLLLEYCFKSLRPGGKLVLSTPNAVATHMLSKIVQEQAPRMYIPHVREYGPHELSEMLTSSGFEIERFETHDVWGINIRQDVAAWASKVIARPEMHGEMMLVVARRPE